jgi:predicted GTPase
MEALTCGRGETIGKGRQNTTLEAQEYQWKDLIIIDTPGIDSMLGSDELETTALNYADGSDLILFLIAERTSEFDARTTPKQTQVLDRTASPAKLLSP